MTKKSHRDALQQKKHMSFDEAVTRFMRVTPDELAEKIAQDVVPSADKAKARISKVQGDIDNAGRPRKGRFRL